jgi:hypothetical protein
MPNPASIRCIRLTAGFVSGVLFASTMTYLQTPPTFPTTAWEAIIAALGIVALVILAMTPAREPSRADR